MSAPLRIGKKVSGSPLRIGKETKPKYFLIWPDGHFSEVKTVNHFSNYWVSAFWSNALVNFCFEPAPKSMYAEKNQKDFYFNLTRINCGPTVINLENEV